MDLGSWGGVAIGDMEDFGGPLPCGAKKGAVAAESGARSGAGVAHGRRDGDVEYTAFEESAGERAI